MYIKQHIAFIIPYIPAPFALCTIALTVLTLLFTNWIVLYTHIHAYYLYIVVKCLFILLSCYVYLFTSTLRVQNTDLLYLYTNLATKADFVNIVLTYLQFVFKL